MSRRRDTVWNIAGLDLPKPTISVFVKALTSMNGVLNRMHNCRLLSQKRYRDPQITIVAFRLVAPIATAPKSILLRNNSSAREM